MTPRETAEKIVEECMPMSSRQYPRLIGAIAAAIEKAGRVPEGYIRDDKGVDYDIGVLHEDGRPKGSPRDWWHGGTWVTPGMKVIECYPREAAAKGGGDGDC